MDAGFWMGLQADFDLWHALRDVDLSKITPLKKSGDRAAAFRIGISWMSPRRPDDPFTAAA